MERLSRDVQYVFTHGRLNYVYPEMHKVFGVKETMRIMKDFWNE